MAAAGEVVDAAVAHDLKTQKCVMRLKTSSRRLFAFVAMYSFLHRQLTDGEEFWWCSARTLLSGVARIIKVLEARVKYFSDRLDRLQSERTRVDPGLLMSRHMELADPDRKIWKRMRDSNVVPEKVVQAYENVKHLLPSDDARQPRAVERGTAYAELSSADFYGRYIRSDIAVAKSNELSEMFSENFEVLPGKVIRVPRRLERHFNLEKKNSRRRFPSNYVRGMTFAYSVGEMFGGAFAATQIYITGFTKSASIACGNRAFDSCSKSKAFLKSNELFTPRRRPPPQRRAAGAFLVPVVSANGDARKTIVESVNFVPDRKEKAVVALMRSAVAEHEPGGYMAVWLALAISRLLGRRVTPAYAILFLANWTAKQFQENNDDEALKRLSASVGIKIDHEHGLVVPVVVFGSGLTATKLRSYAVRCIDQVVRKLLKTGATTTSRDDDTAHLTLQQLSARLFRNVTAAKNSSEEAIPLCSMKGEEFVPNNERRRIREEEYNKALHPDLRLKFRFGVCGYQHPLPASGDKEALVAQQLLKDRQIYAQRETAAATNWHRLLQFLFPSSDGFAFSRLSSLSRRFVEIAQTAIKSAVPCERVVSDVNAKFNADILTLGSKPDSFLRAKAGLVIGEHARQALQLANHALGRYEECRRVSSLHPSEVARDSALGKLAVDLAHGCVIAREHQRHYAELEPFIPAAEEPFHPIPFYGIENPIFPSKNSCVDLTATTCNDPVSSFWLEESNAAVDALRSRGVLSFPALDAAGRNLDMNLLKELWDRNHRRVASDKPRKYRDDPAPWSSKFTGQSGRSTTEFSPNSVIVLAADDEDEDGAELNDSYRGIGGEKFTVGGRNDVFLAAVESQRNTVKNDIVYPRTRKEGDKCLIDAPDISPIYRYGGKPAVLSLRRSRPRMFRIDH